MKPVYWQIPRQRLWLVIVQSRDQRETFRRVRRF